MRNTVLLSKIYLKEMWGSFAAGSSKSGKSSAWAKVALILMPLMFLPMVFTISMNIYYSFRDMGLVEFAPAFAYMIASGFVFFTAFSTVLSAIGGDKSITQLTTLPIKARQIFTARILLVYFLTFLEVLYFLFPMMLFIAKDFGAATILPAIIACVVCPILPMSLALLVIMPMARLLVNSALKKIINVILNIVFFVAYFIFITSSSEIQHQADTITELMRSRLSSMFPPCIFAGDFILGNMMQGLILIVGSLALGFLVLWSCGFLAKVVLETPENKSVKKGKVTLETKPVFLRLLGRQFAVINSSQRFILACYVNALITPLLLLMYQYMGVITIDKIQHFNETSGAGKWVLMAIFLSCVTLSTFGGSNIAREGKTFWQNKVIPIPAKTQVLSRFMFTLLISMPIGLIATIAYGVLLELPILDIIIAIASATGYSLFLISIDHMNDIKFPNLNWTHENQAVKNSKALSFSMLTKLGVTFVLVLVAILVQKWTNFSGLPTMIIVLGVVLGVFGVWRLFTKGVKLYEKIEA